MNFLTKEKSALVEMDWCSYSALIWLNYKVAKICLLNAFSFSMLFNMALKNEISFSTEERMKKFGNGILLPKLFWPTVRKKVFCWQRKTFERGNAQKGLWAHLASLFPLFLVFEFFSFGPPWKPWKKSSVSSDLSVSFKRPQKKSICWEFH